MNGLGAVVVRTACLVAAAGLVAGIGACGAATPASMPPTDRVQPRENPAPPAPFEIGLRAPRFAVRTGWHIRASGELSGVRCGHQREAWAATVPFHDGFSALPPHHTLSRLPPGGIVIGVVISRDHCNPSAPNESPSAVFPLRSLPPHLDSATSTDVPGRHPGVRLYVINGWVAGRYGAQTWVFFGRTPTPGQWHQAQGMLDALRWPARLSA